MQLAGCRGGEAEREWFQGRHAAGSTKRALPRHDAETQGHSKKQKTKSKRQRQPGRFKPWRLKEEETPPILKESNDSPIVLILST